MEGRVKKTIDAEKMLVCAAGAFITAFGVIAGGLAFIGVPFTRSNAGLLVVGTGILWGLFWAFFLLFGQS